MPKLASVKEDNIYLPFSTVVMINTFRIEKLSHIVMMGTKDRTEKSE